ncbi:hypothetical protein THAR02_10846, partial [Trichoderma harzianum]
LSLPNLHHLPHLRTTHPIPSPLHQINPPSPRNISSNLIQPPLSQPPHILPLLLLPSPLIIRPHRNPQPRPLKKRPQRRPHAPIPIEHLFRLLPVRRRIHPALPNRPRLVVEIRHLRNRQINLRLDIPQTPQQIPSKTLHHPQPHRETRRLGRFVRIVHAQQQHQSRPLRGRRSPLQRRPRHFCVCPGRWIETRIENH